MTDHLPETTDGACPACSEPVSDHTLARAAVCCGQLAAERSDRIAAYVAERAARGLPQRAPRGH